MASTESLVKRQLGEIGELQARITVLEGALKEICELRPCPASETPDICIHGPKVTQRCAGCIARLALGPSVGETK